MRVLIIFACTSVAPSFDHFYWIYTAPDLINCRSTLRDCFFKKAKEERSNSKLKRGIVSRPEFIRTMWAVWQLQSLDRPSQVPKTSIESTNHFPDVGSDNQRLDYTYIHTITVYPLCFSILCSTGAVTVPSNHSLLSSRDPSLDESTLVVGRETSTLNRRSNKTVWTHQPFLTLGPGLSFQVQLRHLTSYPTKL